MLSDRDIALLRRLVEAREKRDETDAAARRAAAEYREIEAEVHEELTDGPVQRLNNVDLGPPYGRVSFHAKETTYGRILDKDQALDYIEERQMADEMTESKIVMARVNEIVRECVEEGQDLPPGFDFYRRPYVQITRQKAGG